MATFISVYSGAGGLDLGFAQAGFDPLFANDIDPDAVSTYNRIHTLQDPAWDLAAQKFKCHSAVCGDVLSATSSLTAGEVDLIIGGPPCQGFSTAGRMDPDDPRSVHVIHFAQLVERLRPLAFVMENVPSLATSSRWGATRSQLMRHVPDTYTTELFVLNASHWDVPQARQRMFWIGIRGERPLPLFDEGPTLSSPPSCRDALLSLPPVGNEGNDSTCPAAIVPAKQPVLRRSPYAGMLFNGQGRVIDLDKPAPTLPASMGGNRTPIIDEGNLRHDLQPWILQYHAQLQRGKPPLTSLPPGTPLRRLTTEEAALLQSFPLDMSWRGSQSSIFRQIGNAVPPRLAWAVAEYVGKLISSL